MQYFFYKINAYIIVYNNCFVTGRLSLCSTSFTKSMHTSSSTTTVLLLEGFLYAVLLLQNQCIHHRLQQLFCYWKAFFMQYFFYKINAYIIVYNNCFVTGRLSLCSTSFTKSMHTSSSTTTVLLLEGFLYAVLLLQNQCIHHRLQQLFCYWKAFFMQYFFYKINAYIIVYNNCFVTGRLSLCSTSFTKSMHTSSSTTTVLLLEGFLYAVLLLQNQCIHHRLQQLFCYWKAFFMQYFFYKINAYIIVYNNCFVTGRLSLCSTSFTKSMHTSSSTTTVLLLEGFLYAVLLLQNQCIHHRLQQLFCYWKAFFMQYCFYKINAYIIVYNNCFVTGRLSLCSTSFTKSMHTSSSTTTVLLLEGFLYAVLLLQNQCIHHRLQQLFCYWKAFFMQYCFYKINAYIIVYNNCFVTGRLSLCSTSFTKSMHNIIVYNNYGNNDFLFDGRYFIVHNFLPQY